MRNHPGAFRGFFSTLAAATFLAMTLSSCAVTVALPGGGNTTTPIKPPTNIGTGASGGALQNRSQRLPNQLLRSPSPKSPRMRNQQKRQKRRTKKPTKTTRIKKQSLQKSQILRQNQHQKRQKLKMVHFIFQQIVPIKLPPRNFKAAPT